MIKKITLFTSVTTIFKYFFLVLFFNSFLLFSQNRIPQQPENPSAPGGELVLGERSVLWIRGVDPATRTWNVPDENIAEAERLMKEYYTKISYGKATVSSFDITPVYDFTLINNDFRGPMSAAAEADGYDLSTYNMVIYNFDAAATIAGGASASGNGSGSMNLPAVVIRTGQYKGFIHEGLHTFGLGHAEGLDGGNDLFPGKTLGGVDPYHFLGSEFDAGLDADVPMYFKYSVGWLNEENIPLQPINPTSCTTHRIYEFANVSKENFREDRHYGVQYGDEFILSYMPESANSHFATRGGNLGVLLQWQPKQSEDITRLIDTKPQSLETERANDIYAPVADFWDAALEEGDELSFMGDIIKIVATGGSGQQQWVDIEICSCISISGDSDGDGVCDALDQCPGTDDTLDVDNDSIPDACDDCPNSITNDVNNNGVCDNLECLNGAEDNFEYGVNDNLLLVSTNDTTGQNWKSKWTLDGASAMQDVDRVSVESGSLTTPLITGVGNKLRFIQNTGGKTIIFRDLDNTIENGDTFWISYLFKANDRAGDFLVNGRRLAFGKFNSGGMGIYNDRTQTLPVENNRTYWLVARYKTTSSDTTIDLWVDPSPDTFDENNPTMSSTSSEVINRLEKIVIIQETGNKSDFEMDDLRLGCSPPAELSNCELVGLSCDDGNACTINDVYDENCNCYGTFADTDNDGICNAEDSEGESCILNSPCDDGNECTINDRVDEDCNCTGELNDSNNDKVCDIIECDIDAYEGFEYASGDFKETANGGVGFRSNWDIKVFNESNAVVSNPELDLNIVEGSLNYDNLLSFGNSLRIGLKNKEHVTISRNFDENILNTTAVIWSSYLLNVNAKGNSSLQMQLDNRRDLGVGKRRGEIFGIQNITIPKPVLLLNNTYWVVVQYVNKGAGVDVNVWINPTKENFDITSPNYSLFSNNRFSEVNSISFSTSSDRTEAIFELDEFRIGCNPPSPLLESNQNCTAENAVLQEIIVNNRKAIIGKAVIEVSQGDEVIISARSGQELINAPDLNTYTIIDQDGNAFQDNHTFTVDNTNTGFYTIRNQLGCEVQVIITTGIEPIPDADNDGVFDKDDNCPNTPNPDQADSNDNGIGDVCETPTDSDNDGVFDKYDNCPITPNPDQLDTDKDGIGDVCDLINDTDGDGVRDALDNCVNTANSDQADLDKDGLGDICDDDNDVLMYPNPAIDVLNLSYDHNGDYAFMIHTLSGKRIKYAKNVDKIIISSLPEGVYLMTITNFEKKEKTTQKFIIRRK